MICNKCNAPLIKDAKTSHHDGNQFIKCSNTKCELSAHWYRVKYITQPSNTTNAN